MHDVFISYSTRDREQAYAVRAYLRDRGISCWMAPESIPTGSNYTKEIPVAIRTCRVFLLILSDNAQKSPWVLRELDSAVNNSKNILPYLLDDAPMVDEFQFLLTGCQWQLSWQENALEGLAARIRALLPPPAPVPEDPEAPAPEIPAAPVLQPVPAPAAQTGFLCPACGSSHVQPLKHDRCSHTGGESLWLSLAWIAGLAALLPVSYFISAWMDALGLCVKHRFFYSIDTFTDPGYTIIALLSVTGAAGIGLICHRSIRRKIRHRRVKKGIRACGMVCRDCRKHFPVTVPAMTRFPWETAVEPGIPTHNVAVVRCPGCGTEKAVPRKGMEGSFDRKEKWFFLPAWLAGGPAGLLLVLPVDALLREIPLFVATDTGRYATLNPLGVLTAVFLVLAGAWGIVRLVRIPLKEPIRRRRVRRHIRACGFRCSDCGIGFRLAIPLTHKFPHELSSAAGLRQGKDS